MIKNLTFAVLGFLTIQCTQIEFQLAGHMEKNERERLVDLKKSFRGQPNAHEGR